MIVEGPHALEVDLEERLRSPYPRLAALDSFRAAGDGFGQIEVLPGVRQLLRVPDVLHPLWRHAEQPPCRGVGEHHLTFEVRGEHTLAEVLQNGIEGLLALLEPAEGVLKPGGHRVEGSGEIAELVVVAGLYAGGEIPLLYRLGGQVEPLDPPAQERGHEQHQAAPDHGGDCGGLHVAAREDLQHRRLAVTRDEHDPAAQFAVSHDRHGGDLAVIEPSGDAIPAGHGLEDAIREWGGGRFTCPGDDLCPAVYQDHLSAGGIGDGPRRLPGLVGARLLDGRRRGRRLGKRVIL